MTAAAPAYGADPARYARLRACTILLVDDETANLDLLEALLEGEGYRSLVRTSDAREASALAGRHRPDLVLLDLHMPHRDGFAVLADLRAATPPDEYRPVLVLTADATWEARERALALGARDFVTKPFETAEVLLRVENLLEARTLHAEERAARERAEAAEARATLLADWGRLLAASRDPAAALARLPELLVPRWACACATVARGPGGAARALAAAVADDLRDAGAMVGALRARAAAALAGGHDDEDPPLLAAAIETADGPTAAIAVAGGGPGLRTLVEELASRAGLAAEHARLLAAAERAMRERERLLAVVAHDLRDPLNTVAGYAELLAGRPADGDDGSARSALAIIRDSAATMQRRLDDLLGASPRPGGA